MRARLLLSLAVLACLSAGPGAVLAGPPPQTGQSITDPLTVRVPSAIDEPILLDPDKVSNSASGNVLEQLYLGLVDIDDATSEVRPELATSWTISPNGRVYTFTLRSDAYWSDGHAVTAHDAAFALLRTLDPTRAPNVAWLLYVIENAQAYNEGTITDPSAVGIEVLDPTHLRITLHQPASHFLSILANWAARPLPQHVLEGGAGDWALAGGPIFSSGPYVLSEWVEGHHLTLDKNPYYYDAANVQIERIVAMRLSDAAAWQAYLNGHLDTAPVPPGTPLDPSWRALVTLQPRPSTYFYGFNVALPPFDQPLVRKAFSAAINRRELVRDVVGGAAQPALTFTPPGIFGYVDGYAEGVGLPYDPTQARRWLRDAGYPNGQGLPPITLWFSSGAGHQAIAEYIRQSWIDTLDVTVDLRSLPWGFGPGQYMPYINGGQAQVWRLAWTADHSEAQTFLDSAMSVRSRHGGWTHAGYEALLAQAAAEQDPAARALLYRQAEEILVETEAVIVPVYHYGVFTAAKPYLLRTYPCLASPDVAQWRLLTNQAFLPIIVKSR